MDGITLIDKKHNCEPSLLIREAPRNNQALKSFLKHTIFSSPEPKAHR